MTFCEETWQRTDQIRERIYALPFVQGLGDGSLPRERFQYYMGQDALYLAQYGRALAGVAALSDDPDELVFWAEAARNAIVVERSLHASHVDVLQEATPSPTCRAYTSFLLSHTQSGSYGEAVAAVLPCFWIYQDVGEVLLRQAGDLSGHPYGDWLSAYTDPFFASQTLKVRAIADRLAASGGADLRERMHATYAQAARYEWMFWDAAWRMEQWAV